MKAIQGTKLSMRVKKAALRVVLLKASKPALVIVVCIIVCMAIVSC